MTATGLQEPVRVGVQIVQPPSTTTTKSSSATFGRRQQVNALNAAFALELQDQATVCGLKVPTLDDVKDSLKMGWLTDH